MAATRSDEDLLVARSPSKRNDEQREDGEEHEDEDEHGLRRQAIGTRIFGLSGRSGSGRSRRLATNRAEDAIDAGDDGLIGMARTDFRRDGLVDDPLGGHVGHHRFKSVADLDAQFAIVWKDEQNQPVV